MSKRTHADILRACKDYLKLRHWKVVHIRTTGIRKLDGSFIPAVEVGVADLIAIKAGELPLAIEAKSIHDTLRPHQRAWHKDWEAHGGQTIVAYSVDDVMRLIL